MADTLTVRSLSALPAEVLCATSNEAFRDYPVSVQMTVPQLRTMLRQNDVALPLSAGLFDSERLVGFWLNGVRTREGRKVGYDSGTAICKPYRGRGLSRRLAALSDRLLIQQGVHEYFLEVLTQNETAYRMYLKDGFRVTRRLLCLKAGTPFDGDDALPAGLALEEVAFEAAAADRLPAMEYRPSWQHTTRAMLNVGAGVRAVVVRRGDRVVGYGAILPEAGRITRFAVDESRWDGPLPTLILKQLCRAAGSAEVMMNNVDPGAQRTLALLQRNGFRQYVDQYEMAKSLGG